MPDFYEEKRNLENRLTMTESKLMLAVAALNHIGSIVSISDHNGSAIKSFVRLTVNSLQHSIDPQIQNEICIFNEKQIAEEAKKE